ncbi:MAG: TetR family transcriptional regulator [Halieaceae bacterium]|jgi:AcrR family transcriptional regulator|nr:TetR family transcriptional regulator [Halieaceae bacterium]
MTSARRPQKRALETRNALVDTAIATFSTRGFEGISIRQLEEQAGVKRGLVAYHFGDKDQLWREAADRLFEELAEDFLARLDALAEVAPEEAMRGIVRAFVRFSAARPELNRLMMQESVAESWRVAYIVDEKIRPLIDTLYEMMPQAALLLWGDRDPHRYYLFIGAGAFVFSAAQECRQLFGVDPRSEDFVEHHVDMVINLIGRR